MSDVRDHTHRLDMNIQRSKNIVVIPARGGSKGIPRKNLRPLGGKPLIYYSIHNALCSPSVDSVVVSTDDDEIALFAQRFGAEVVQRPPELADDIATLDPVICHAINELEKRSGHRYELILTLQPTSPLISSEDIENAISTFDMQNYDSLVSVVDDRHLCWTIENGVARPLYSERVNRQQLPAQYKETGAILACTRQQLDSGTRIGSAIQLFELPEEKSIDIDTFEDFQTCNHLIGRQHIVFNVVGHPQVGTGHVYRALMLAHEFIDARLTFICSEQDTLAVELVSAQNYPIAVVPKVNAGALVSLAPDLVINDVLDTEAAFVLALKKSGAAVVNFEDMGEGADCADLVINALYPHQIPGEHVKVGPEYFCLRDEFIHLPEKDSEQLDIARVLLTFGGVDEGNVTLQVLKSIDKYCQDHGINVDIVTGPGFMHEKSVLSFLNERENPCIHYVGNTRTISDYMLAADLAFTSGGRTVLELAALRVPMVVICQNERELTHTFASSENGIVNLGLRTSVEESKILSVLKRYHEDKHLRQVAVKKLAQRDYSRGKERVISLIRNIKK